MQQSVANKNMLEFYKDMNENFSISTNNVEISVNFNNFAETIKELSTEVKTIVNKLNALLPKDFKTDIMKNYKTDLADLANKICMDISSKLDDGILEPLEIVHVVTGALTGITMLINSKTAQLKDNTIEIKYVLTHFVLSLLIIVLTSLATANIINHDTVLSILKTISDQIETYRLTSEMLNQTSLATCCNCIIC